MPRHPGLRAGWALLSALLLGTAMFPGDGLAATRVKTIEYSFGGFYGGDPLPPGEKLVFPSRVVRLPERGKSILAAWLEFEDLILPGPEDGRLRIEFDAGADPATPLLDIGSIVPGSKEAVRVTARADVTSVVSAAEEGLTAGLEFTAAGTVMGRSHAPQAMKLLVTYSFDDSSPRQAETVRFPLLSDEKARIGSFRAPRPPGTHALRFWTEIADDDVSIEQQWFEVRGYKLGRGGSSKGTVSCRIQGAASGPAMLLPDGRRESYEFLYVSSPSRAPGFVLGSRQTLQVSLPRDTVSLLGGEAVVTFTASGKSAEQTRTARYILERSTAGPSAFAASVRLVDAQTVAQAAYARVIGSPTLRTGILKAEGGAGRTVPPLSYELRSSPHALTGYTLLHDLTGAPWADDRTTALSLETSGQHGSHAVELLLTYRRRAGPSRTESFSLPAGQSGGGVASFSAPLRLPRIPEPASRLMASGYVAAELRLNGKEGTARTSLSLDGIPPQPVTHRTTSAPVLLRQLYSLPEDPAAGPVERRVEYGAGDRIGVLGGKVFLTYSVLPAPLKPAYLSQKDRGGSHLPLGAWTGRGAIRLAGVMMSPLRKDSLTLQVELKPEDQPFNGAGLAASGPLEFSRTAVSTTVAIGGLISGTAYHWRARAVGAGGPGPWTGFGGNKEGRRDFGMDLDHPPAPLLSRAVPAEGRAVSRQRLTLDWDDAQDRGGSGIDSYEVEVSTAADFSTLFVGVAAGRSEAAIEGLADKTAYYWRVRATDAAGNTGPFSQPRTFKVELPAASGSRTRAELVLIGISLLVFLAHFFAAMFEKTKVPDVLPLLALGVLIGPVTGLVTPESFGKVGSVFALATLVIILFEGGLSLDFDMLKGSANEGLRLTFATFLATVACVIAACWPTGLLPFLDSVLLGAILGAAAPTVIIPIVERISISERAKTTLVLESSLSDVLCIVLSMALLNSMTHEQLRPGAVLGEIIASFTLAGVIGAGGAVFWANLLEYVRGVKNNMFMTPTFVILVFGVSELLGFSGAISSLVFGIVLGNLTVLHRRFPGLGRLLPSHSIHLNETETAVLSEVVFIVRTFFFVFIGLSVSVSAVGTGLLALTLCGLLFAARVPIVRLALDPSSRRSDAVLASVLIPKGLATAVLASLPLQAGLASGQMIQDIGYGVVILSILACALLVFLAEHGHLKPAGRLALSNFEEFPASAEPPPDPTSSP